MKRSRKIIIWSVLIGYVIIALIFARSSRKEVVCNSISVTIADDDKYRFVKEKEILKLIERPEKSIIGSKLNKLDCSNIEQKVYKHPAVSQADVYTTIDGKLHIRITQRKPIIRISNKNGTSFYIDSEGKPMPVSENFSAQTLYANGNIQETLPLSKIKAFTDEADTIKVASHHILFELYKLAVFIDSDEFWRNQIQQVYVNDKYEIELIPTIGDHVILLGNTNDLENKFNKLNSMYYAFNQIGWNKYSYINLKFNNQIICTKNMPHESEK
jgi:cell division protein FtsQ